MWLSMLMFSQNSLMKPKTALCDVRSINEWWPRRWDWRAYHSDFDIGHSKKRWWMFSFLFLQSEHNGLWTKWRWNSLSFKNRMLFKILYWNIRVYVSTVAYVLWNIKFNIKWNLRRWRFYHFFNWDLVNLCRSELLYGTNPCIYTDMWTEVTQVLLQNQICVGAFYPTSWNTAFQLYPFEWQITINIVLRTKYIPRQKIAIIIQ